jgi:hypothetical protein
MQRKLRTKLRYTATLAYSQAAGNTYEDIILHINDLTDPSGAASATQPNYYDQYAALYNSFRVDHIKARVAIMPASGDVTSFVKLAASPSGTALQSVAQAAQRVCTSTKLVFFKSTVQPIEKVHVIDIDPADVLGRTKQQYMTDLDYSGLAGSSPSKLVYLHCVMNNGSGVQTWTANCVVDLELDVEFFDPKQVIDA